MSTKRVMLDYLMISAEYDDSGPMFLIANAKLFGEEDNSSIQMRFQLLPDKAGSRLCAVTATIYQNEGKEPSNLIVTVTEPYMDYKYSIYDAIRISMHYLKNLKEINVTNSLSSGAINRLINSIHKINIKQTVSNGKTRCYEALTLYEALTTAYESFIK